MWGGRFDAAPSQLLRALNDSFAFDRELLTDDVQGSVAWAQALAAGETPSPDMVAASGTNEALAMPRVPDASVRVEASAAQGKPCHAAPEPVPQP